MKYGPYPQFEKALLPYLLQLQEISPQMSDEEVRSIKQRHYPFCAGNNIVTANTIGTLVILP